MERTKYWKTLGCGAVFVFACALSLPGRAAEPRTVVVEGKTLKHLGTGLREFLFIDIYKLSAYSESGSCSLNDIVNKDESKVLKLRAMRELPVDRIKSSLEDSFEDNMPPGDNTALKAKVARFLGAFKQDLKEGTTMQILYTPGKGTSVSSAGAAIGANIPGKDFADLVWRSYFGNKTCCSSVKSAIVEQCGK